MPTWVRSGAALAATLPGDPAAWTRPRPRPARPRAPPASAPPDAEEAAEAEVDGAAAASAERRRRLAEAFGVADPDRASVFAARDAG